MLEPPSNFIVLKVSGDFCLSEMSCFIATQAFSQSTQTKFNVISNYFNFYFYPMSCFSFLDDFVLVLSERGQDLSSSSKFSRLSVFDPAKLQLRLPHNHECWLAFLKAFKASVNLDSEKRVEAFLSSKLFPVVKLKTL